MANNLSEQMKGLSLENDKIVGKCLDREINFCLNVEQRFTEFLFEQPVGLRFVYSKILITLLFLSEKRLSARDATTVCSVTEKCFNQDVHKLGWCANYKIDQERVEVGNFNHSLMFSCVKNSEAGWGKNDDVSEENLCECIMCEGYA